MTFSAKDRQATYIVKPVLEGKDFAAAEKLYQQKLKEYNDLQLESKRKEKEEQKKAAEKIRDNKKVSKALEEDNVRIEELNKLITLRNKFIEAENKRIDAINKQAQMRRDSAIQRNLLWEQSNRTASLQQNLIRSFAIDGFGYWNCDMPTLPDVQQYAGIFKTMKNEVVTYKTLCIASEGINRIQNYYSTESIGLIKDASCFGWTFDTNRFYYFTTRDFNNAKRTNNPNSIAITMTLYEGDLNNYERLKAFLFNINNNKDLSVR